MNRPALRRDGSCGRRVVVELEPVRALAAGLAVELLAVVRQVDREVVVDLGRQTGRSYCGMQNCPAGPAADPEHVVPDPLAHDVHVAARILAE
jgi:hypothetical protein